MMNQDGTLELLTELGQDTNELESYINPNDLEHIHQFLELMKYSAGLKFTINKFKEMNLELYQIKKYFVMPESPVKA